jgi:sugar (pentulose or hexulose) kinase
MTDLALGIDLGTHGARALAAGLDGTIYAQGAYPYQRQTTPDGVQEQPLAPIWHALGEAARQVLSALEPGQRIAAVGVTHQRGTLVALDQQGQPLGPAICDSDSSGGTRNSRSRRPGWQPGPASRIGRCSS